MRKHRLNEPTYLTRCPRPQTLADLLEKRYSLSQTDAGHAVSLMSVANIVMTPLCGFAFSFLRQSSILVLVPFLLTLMCLCHLYLGFAPLNWPVYPGASL